MWITIAIAIVLVVMLLLIVFAPQIGRLNDHIVSVGPPFLKALYSRTSLGKPFSSGFWITYTRVGAVLAAALVIAVLLFIGPPSRGR